MVKGLRRWIHQQRRGRQRRKRLREQRAQLLNDPRRNEKALVVRTHEASPELFYVFQGRNMRLMMEPLTFFRATGLLRSNLVLLRDFHQAFYHAGISDELASVEAIRERLVELRRSMPHVERSYGLGTSMGGYAALLFGHYVEADVVYAFAPQTLLYMDRIAPIAGKALVRGPIRDRARFLRREMWRFPEAHRDLALLLAEHNGRTRYEVFFCEDAPLDRFFAEHVAGCPGVTLHPQPCKRHQVVRAMHAQGTLSEALLAR